MTTVNTRKYRFRVWRQRTLHEDEGRKEIIAAIKELMQDLPKLSLCKSILRIKGVNAVEVVDINGDGEVLYKDWP